MTTRFDSRGNAVPVTVVFASPNLVVGHRQQEKDGYTAIQVGFETAKKPKNPQKINYKNLQFVPKNIKEFRVSEISEDIQPVGAQLTVGDFSSGDILKVTGTSRGKGFAGVVKRWGFAGGPRTHGQSDRERAPGSIGQTTTPGRVYKGKKMAGHTGNVQTTITGVTVYDVDTENNLIFIKGALPGWTNSMLLIEKVGSKKPLVESKPSEEENSKDVEAQSTQPNPEPEEAVTDQSDSETQEQIETKSTEEGSEAGESSVDQTPVEKSSDSPTPPSGEETKEEDSK